MSNLNRYPKNILELAQDKIYVIIKNDSVFIEGNERSKTNPGHGYPAHTQYFLDIQQFDDKEKFIEEITCLSNNKISFRAFTLNPIKVTTNINIEVSVDE